MSEVIQGAKSRSYVKNDPIPGIENCQDSLEYNTVQELPGNRGGIDAVIHGSYTVSTGHIVEAGSVKRLIKSTAHGAKKGWIMRPTTSREEIAIVKIVDANTFIISDVFNISIADTFDLCRFVTPNYTEDGDLNVVVTASGPVQFLKDTVITTVEEDTATPANNEALPTKMFIEIDGVVYPVRKDTAVPSNTVSVPVEITGASGPINITAGDINVQLSDQGPNADVTRIGNGTNQWGINASNEGLVHDADTLSAIGDSNTYLSSMSTEIGEINAKTPLLVSGSVPVIGPLTDAELRATPIDVLGPLTDTELRATPVPVTGSTSETAKTGSFDEKLAFSTIQTFIAPANAISANIMNVSTAVLGTANVRYKQGALATGSSGLRLEPGRSEMVMNGSDISIIPETGAVDLCDVAIIWNIQP